MRISYDGKDLAVLSYQQLRELNREYQKKAARELPLNDPSWTHINKMLKDIDAEFISRRVGKLKGSGRGLADGKTGKRGGA